MWQHVRMLIIKIAELNRVLTRVVSINILISLGMRHLVNAYEVEAGMV